MNITTYPAVSDVDFRKHSVYRFTDKIWKIVQFYDDRERHGPGPIENHKSYEEKLPAAVSRAKRCVLEYALCNPWDYFVTLTISPDKFKRDDLRTWLKSLLQWLRDQRKQGSNISYLLIPERHEDGTWHAHGLFHGLPENELESFACMRKKGIRVPSKLVKGGYLNWRKYSDKFGYISLGKIKNAEAAAFYCTKYVTKDNSRLVNDLGWHLYYHSRPLLRPDKFIDLFTRSPEIDRLLTGKYEFCACGFALSRHRLGWVDFASLSDDPCAPIDFGDLVPLDYSEAEAEADSAYACDQIAIEYFNDWRLGN